MPTGAVRLNNHITEIPKDWLVATKFQVFRSEMAYECLKIK